VSYPYGQGIPLIFRFTNDADQPAAPQTLTITVKRPSGTTATLAPTNPATGEYRVTVVCDQPGKWAVEARGTGGGIETSIAYEWTVEPSKVA
jgi:nitrogen fixation protein FixH